MPESKKGSSEPHEAEFDGGLTTRESCARHRQNHAIFGCSRCSHPNVNPFSFREIVDACASIRATPEMLLTATDGVKLAVRAYLPQQKPKAVLVIYHGGGAHSAAGYQCIGHGLCDQYGIAVYTPDLRGHGASGGPRGDSPNSEQVWRDVNTVLEHVREAHPDLSLFLGGHSSGGGLLVNYSSWPERIMTTAGFVLVSPQLGHLSDTARPADRARPEFAKANMLLFVVNAIFGIFGHSRAVRFNYPHEVLANDPGIVSYNTVYMANAITPIAPQYQFSKITLPLGLWVGANDELLLADKVVAFADKVIEPSEGTCGVVVPNVNHLSIVVNAHEFLGPWITEHVTRGVN